MGVASGLYKCCSPYGMGLGVVVGVCVVVGFFKYSKICVKICLSSSNLSILIFSSCAHLVGSPIFQKRLNLVCFV